LLAATIEVGDTVGDGVDAFGFHGGSRISENRIIPAGRAPPPRRGARKASLPGLC
jgi:hypothetical protein